MKSIDRATNTIGCIALIVIGVNITVIATILFVAIHFIRKFW